MWLVLAALTSAGASPVLVAPSGMRTRVATPPQFQVDPNAAPTRCLVRVAVSEGGAPTEVEARGCPADHAAAAAAAVRGWRWDPLRSEGAPVRALVLVAIEFTGRGRLPVPPAPRCTYTLRVAADGAVSRGADPAPQCEAWPPARVSPPRGGGTCAVEVASSMDLSGCEPGLEDVVSEIVSGTLYAAGTDSTRFVLELPTTLARPASAVTTFDIPSPGAEQGPTRLGGAAETQTREPTLAVPTGSVPKVDLSALRDRNKAAPKAPPKPAPAPEPEQTPPPKP